MVFRKITIDNSVRYVSKSEQTQEEKFEPKTIKVGSLPRRQNKNISQNSEKLLNNVAASGFKIPN